MKCQHKCIKTNETQDLTLSVFVWSSEGVKGKIFDNLCDW